MRANTAKTTKVVTISEELHARLKGKAQAEGRKLQAMVETMLEGALEAAESKHEAAAREVAV